MFSRTRIVPLAAWAVIVAYFLAFTHKGLSMGMSADDLMNIQFLHGWGERSFASLVGHSLLVATPAYRPFGGVIYRSLFAAFGLNPLPYRLFCFALLIGNLGLAYRLFVLLSKRQATAIFATLVFAFHTCMAALYFESSTVYDLLCFTFGVSALLVYIQTRQDGLPVLGWRLAGFLALYGLALDSKEMAISWAGLIVLYEAVFHFHGREFRARAIAPALAGAIGIAYSIVKTAIPSAMSINPNYQPRLSPLYIAEQIRHYYELLLVMHSQLSFVALAAGLFALLALAAVLRSKPMIFGLLFANLALLPASVIPGRDGFVCYIPYLGWALYVGTALLLLADALPVRPVYAQAALFIAVLGGLVLVFKEPAQTFTVRFEREQHQLQLLLETAQHNLPSLPPSSRVLMAEDNFETVDWHPLFLLRLAYRDPSIWVDRPSQVPDFDPDDLSVYDAVFYAKQQPYRVTKPEAARVGDHTSIELSPAVVGPGDSLRLRAPGFPNCPTDVEYHLYDDVLQRNGLSRNWCTLDGSGQCRIPIPEKPEPGRAKITRVRFCRGLWMPTSASFEIRDKR